jgi:histidinol-phosphate aminotransferase
VTGSAPPSAPSALDALPLRDELRGQVPYGAPQLDVAVALNTNENPYPPTHALAQRIGAAAADAARKVNRYPDREATALRTDLADYLQRDSGASLDVSNIWAANGSNEIMLQLLQAFGGPSRTAVSFAPTYSMYPEYARDTHTRWVLGRRADDFTVDLPHALELIGAERPSVVFVASPNNPTGTAVPLEDIAILAAAAPGIVVVDEAYGEFRRDGVPSALTLLADHPRLVVTRTMSKAFAFAGGRLGYLAASAAIVDAMQIVRLPYHLSAITQAVARVALAHADELLSTVGELRAERDRTVTWLRSAGLDVADSDANFVLFGTFRDRHAVWQGLLDRGVLIREVGPDGWLRVSIGTGAEMTAFRTALHDALEEVPA